MKRDHPIALISKAGSVMLYYHIDGMYSLCRNKKGELVHPKVWTEVELVGKGEVEWVT